MGLAAVWRGFEVWAWNGFLVVFVCVCDGLGHGFVAVGSQFSRLRVWGGFGGGFGFLVGLDLRWVCGGIGVVFVLGLLWVSYGFVVHWVALVFCGFGICSDFVESVSLLFLLLSTSISSTWSSSFSS